MFGLLISHCVVCIFSIWDVHAGYLSSHLFLHNVLPQNAKKYMSWSLALMELELYHCQMSLQNLKRNLAQKDFQLAMMIKKKTAYHQQILELEKEKDEVKYAIKFYVILELDGTVAHAACLYT